MKVSELIKELEGFPQDLTVYLSSDPEGNDYNPLDKDGMGIMFANSKDKSIKGEEDAFDYEEEFDDFESSVLKHHEMCLVLWPGYWGSK